jgi:hypothetical protein
MQLRFKLTRPAKSGGGDRYEHGIKDDYDFMVIYIPQSISRADDKPRPEITITIE